MEASMKRKFTPDFDKKELESGMRRQKLKALEQHADFVFLIGKEKESAEVNWTLVLNEQ